MGTLESERDAKTTDINQDSPRQTRTDGDMSYSLNHKDQTLPSGMRGVPCSGPNYISKLCPQ